MAKKSKELIFFDKSNFGKNKLARLHLRKSYTNFFLTLTDLQDKVVCTVSTGRVAETNNKRVKRSPVTLSKMMLILRKALILNDLKKIEIILRTKITSELHGIARHLNSFGVTILKISDLRIHAHNGVRGRRIRRT